MHYFYERIIMCYKTCRGIPILFNKGREFVRLKKKMTIHKYTKTIFIYNTRAK